MAKEFFASSPLMVFPVAALLLFLVAFSVIAVRAIIRPKSEIDALANLPIDDGTLLASVEADRKRASEGDR